MASLQHLSASLLCGGAFKEMDLTHSGAAKSVYKLNSGEGWLGMGGVDLTYTGEVKCL